MPDKNVTPEDSSRIAEIRARLDEGGPVLGVDVRWLLEELQETTMRERAAWDIIAEVGTGLTMHQLEDIYQSLMDDYRRKANA